MTRIPRLYQQDPYAQRQMQENLRRRFEEQIRGDIATGDPPAEPDPVVPQSQGPDSNRIPETQRNMIAAVEAGQTKGDPFARAVEVARSRAAGGPQLVLNPFVESNRPTFEKIAEQKDAVEQLLGQTNNPEQKAAIQRVLQATDDRLSGTTTSPDDMFSEASVEAENIARWATRNNVSRGRVSQAMRQLQARQAARTGISQRMSEKAMQAQAQAKQLEAFKQSKPHLAPFATTDPETGQPTVNKVAMDAELKFAELMQGQAQKQAEQRAKMLTETKKIQSEQDKLLLDAFGLAGGPPDPSEVRLANDQIMRASEDAGEAPQFRNIRAEQAAYQQKWEQYQVARSINNRDLFRDILPPDELDERFPIAGAPPSFLANLSPAVQQILNVQAAVTKQPEPLPPGRSPQDVAKERNLHYAPNEAVLQRLKQSGLVRDGDSVVTDQGIVPVKRNESE